MGPQSRILIVMGVSGSGKSTVAALAAERLRWPFRDGDDFHPAANIAKMRAGIPLTDSDREPWLAAIARWIDAQRAVAGHGVIACSALKRAYRNVLIGPRADVGLVYLDAPRALMEQRLAARLGHFMPAALLDSQYAALEPPDEDEQALRVDPAATPEASVDLIVQTLGQT